ncbi:hypothetical protein BDN72DRAFT_831630 [Pluteus cervinus]|uniref:Uncharacterized protein n=1 Tax=Pluteus cervinus TaxID=181527 RepID=A0ACD3BDS7_9AGAR|nr:hypothetical protein BDN72DRAFT_831630 [Pluteus cervinus]
MSPANFTPFVIVVAAVGGALLLATSFLIILFVRNSKRREVLDPERDGSTAESASGQIISIMAPLQWDGENWRSPRSRFSDETSISSFAGSIPKPDPAVTVFRPPLLTSRVDGESPVLRRPLLRYGRSDVASLPPPPSPTQFIDRPLPPVPSPSATSASPVGFRSPIDWSPGLIVDDVVFRFVRPPSLVQTPRSVLRSPLASQIPSLPTIIRRKRSFSGIEQRLQTVGVVNQVMGSAEADDGRNRDEEFSGPRALNFADGNLAPITSPMSFVLHRAKQPQQPEFTFLELPPPQRSFLSFATDSGSAESDRTTPHSTQNYEGHRASMTDKVLVSRASGGGNNNTDSTSELFQAGSPRPGEASTRQSRGILPTEPIAGTPEARFGVSSREQLYSRVGLMVRPPPRLPSPSNPIPRSQYL